MTRTAIEKAPGACDTEGFNTDICELDFATGAPNSKANAPLIEELALAGHAVHRLRIGDRWAFSSGNPHGPENFDALQVFDRLLGLGK